jgi:hypothetical protein
MAGGGAAGGDGGPYPAGTWGPGACGAVGGGDGAPG